MEYLLGKHRKSRLSLNEEEELKNIILKQYPSLKDSSENIIDAGLILSGSASILKDVFYETKPNDAICISTDNIYNSNRRIYHVEKENIFIKKLIAQYLIKKVGIIPISIMGVAFLILSLILVSLCINSILHLFTFLPTFPLKYTGSVLLLSILLLFSSLLSIIVVDYYHNTKCENCKKEMAYEEVGIPTITEVDTLNGLQKQIERKYKCKFCGDIRVQSYKGTKPVMKK